MRGARQGLCHSSADIGHRMGQRRQRGAGAYLRSQDRLSPVRASTDAPPGKKRQWLAVSPAARASRRALDGLWAVAPRGRAAVAVV